MRLFALATLLCCSPLATAATPEPPKITTTSADSTSITLNFDQPMLTWDEKASVSTLHIDSDVSCQWYWDDDTKLTCRTNDRQESFHMASAYHVRIGRGLWSQAGVEMLPRDVLAETKRPEINASIHDWIGGVPQVRLNSEQALVPGSIERAVTVDFEGRALHLQVVPVPDARVHAIPSIRGRARGDDQPPREYELHVLDLPATSGLLRFHVHPGLQSAEGPLTGIEDKEFIRALVNEPHGLRNASCKFEYNKPRIAYVAGTALAIDCDPGRPIGLFFSRTPSAAMIAAFKVSLPAGVSLIDAKDTRDYWGQSARPKDGPLQSPDAPIYLKTSVAGTQLDVKLPASLLAEGNTQAAEQGSLLLHINDYPKGYRIKPAVLVAATGSTALPLLETRNVATGPQLLRMTIGDRAQLLSSQLQTSAALNEVHPADLPKAPDAIREHGGLVLGGAKFEPGYGYAMAYAPFNVLVSAGDQQMLVWASTWGESRNLANAKVELLSVDTTGDLKVLATAVTGGDGVALLDVARDDTSDFTGPEVRRVVRVTQGDLRTVVPVLGWNFQVNSLQHYDAHHQDSGRFTNDTTRSFGVTDRPLYRPGESVNYRVWLRQRNGNRLVRADKDKVTLTLRSGHGWKTLQSWTATLDELGSASGQLHLPALLPDDTYCVGADIGERDYYGSQGACFEVTRFDAQALWASLDVDHKAVMAGGDLALQLESGYFSGDAAAHVAIQFSGVLTLQRLDSAYPEFAAYTFIAPFSDADSGRDTDPLQGVTTPAFTDAKGKAHFVLHLPAVMKPEGDAGKPLVFGQLEFTAAISIPGKASANSPAASVNYSQYARYVGLKSAQWWLPLDDDPQLEAVVITHDGHAVPGQAVQVSIAADDDEQAEHSHFIGNCQLVSGQPSPCAFRAPRAGRYRFSAGVEGAAPTVLTRYIGTDAPVDAAKPDQRATLTLLHASDGKSPARVKLHQPYPKANVLFAFEYGHVVGHFAQTVTGADSEIDVPLQAGWAPGVTLHALIRSSGAGSAPAGVDSQTLDAVLDLDIPQLRNDAIAVSLDRPRAAPGGDVVLRLTNGTAGAHHATIALVDDSIYQQASEVNGDADPTSDGWLGSVKNWDRTSWYGLEAWTSVANPFHGQSGFHPGAAVWIPDSNEPFLDRIEVLGGRSRRAVDTEPTQPVTTLTRADIEQTDLASTFDVINRISASDGSGLGTANGQRPVAVRKAFADSAYWNPDVSLAVGETKELRIRLPDNLTRWRVLVWSSDDKDGFALTQTTLETALPLELRAGLPGQLYVGDHATASVSARNHGDAPASLTLKVQADGAGVRLQQARQGMVGGNAELSQRIAFAPDAAGDVQILAHADDTGGGDALSSSVPVLSRLGTEQVTQTGWIDADTLNLPLPSLPAGATSPVLDVQVSSGFDGWRASWLRDLRDYPHRCWEQILSRAVGAALAIESGQDKALWPNAQAEVRDALIVAPAFQDGNGYFRYFIVADRAYGGRETSGLSAYTLRSFQLLRDLGYEPSKESQQSLEKAVSNTLSDMSKANPVEGNERGLELAAQAAGAITDPKLLGDRALDNLWNSWEHLSWYGRSELVRALMRKPEFAEQARTGIERMREAGVQHGLRRVINDGRDFSYAMGSDLRDQCGVVGALYELDKSSEGGLARRSLLRGLQDLYSGGTASLDTQSSAQCLMALRSVAKNLPVDDHERQVLLSLGAVNHTVALLPKEDQGHWSQTLANPAKGVTETLHLQSEGSADATLNYSAELHYQLDLQQAKPHAVGMQLERSYQVLRNGAWVELAKTSLREDDWVRVKLVLDVPAFRHFVAITDVVPGGLVSRDISLSSVGGADLKHIGDQGSWWFDSRQTGQNDVKIYAERLPPGTHEVFYYAQAVQPGDYFAPPATAELMYGRASRSTTAAARLVILPALPAAKH
jgi:uncharacterized protein YfaS (alpha-2-macroglobulin family)